MLLLSLLLVVVFVVMLLLLLLSAHPVGKKEAGGNSCGVALKHCARILPPPRIIYI